MWPCGFQQFQWNTNSFSRPTKPPLIWPCLPLSCYFLLLFSLPFAPARLAPSTSGLIPSIPLDISTGCSLCPEHCACRSKSGWFLVTQGSPQCHLFRKAIQGHRPSGDLKWSLLSHFSHTAQFVFIDPVTLQLFCLLIVIIYLLIISMSVT